jgi:hypothetical protein
MATPKLRQDPQPTLPEQRKAFTEW